MPPRQLRLEGSSLEELGARVRAECGPYAEIIAAEKVTVGGIRGFLARHHFEVTVSIPDAPRDGIHLLDLPARVGIAALLDDADRQEALVHVERMPVAAESVSTNSALFDELMGSLDFSGPPPPRGPAPRLLTGAGDLVLLIGVWRDPLRVARAMAAPSGAAVSVAGGVLAPGSSRIEDRRGATEARAVGVRREHGTLVALGLGPAQDATIATADLVRAIGADQVWVVVDASRKTEDTAAWVQAMAEIVPLDALAVLGRHQTLTPESIGTLGLPVGWVDGASVG